jgi:hypothetical protein
MHSATVGPKQSTQLATHADIAVITELVDVSVVPTKYFPHPSLGLQSTNVALLQVSQLAML